MHNHCIGRPEPYVLHLDSSGAWGKILSLDVILQEFKLEFVKSTSKKSIVFVDIMCDLPHIIEGTMPIDSLPDESLFLIGMSDPSYGYLILYLQTQ